MDEYIRVFSILPLPKKIFVSHQKPDQLVLKVSYNFHCISKLLWTSLSLNLARFGFDCFLGDNSLKFSLFRDYTVKWIYTHIFFFLNFGSLNLGLCDINNNSFLGLFICEIFKNTLRFLVLSKMH